MCPPLRTRQDPPRGTLPRLEHHLTTRTFRGLGLAASLVFAVKPSYPSRMDAVLPLTSRDVERFEILWSSLERFVTGLDTLWIVVPEHQHEQLRARLPTKHRLGGRVRLESELDFLPTLRAFPKTHGWYRQMLLKLQAARRVQSQYYLTLDADVVACRAVDLDQLCSGGKAPCHVDHQDLHPKWYEAAADVLGSPLPRRNVSHGVTPAILHAPSVQSLLETVATRWRQGAYCGGLRGLKQRFGKALVWLKRAQVDPAIAYLCWSRPWAEYALYFSYLELTDQFTGHFEEVTEGIYGVEGSVWHADSFSAWDPSPQFAGSGPPYFMVVQSNASIPVEQIKARLYPLLG